MHTAELKNIKVSAYSGYKANERPIFFILDGRKYIVTEILERWYEEDGYYFKIVADDQCTYTLKWNSIQDLWYIILGG